MTKIKLNKQQEKKLNKLIKEEKKAKAQKRLLFVKMKNEGMSNQKIATIVQVCPDTLTDWNNIFN